MKISSRGRYALRLMIDIAQHNNGGWVTLRDASERQGISVKYLEQIVTNLTKSGMLLSSRGPQGGYKLAKPPEKYTAGQILRAIEGPLAPVACLENQDNTCERQENCTTVKFWEGLYKKINDYVDTFTLADLAARSQADYDYQI